MDDTSASDVLELISAARSPAAVLVVDLATRQVVHANTIAEQLAPATGLPVDLDAWSDAAELHDFAGADLSGTTHPLSWVARSEPDDGQEVSAARGSELGARRDPLWVVAVPMTGAPMLDDHALVVLIPIARSDDAPEIAAAVADDRADQDLRDRALRATALSFTVADAEDPDHPLIWVNPAFTTTTGYAAEEVVGSNCRFLQGPDTDPAGPRRLRDAIEKGVPARVTLRNYRKDGTPFWNEVDLSPVRDADARITHFVGIQTDVTARVEADEEVQRVLLAERDARADAEAARARLSFLFGAVNRLSSQLDVAGCADTLLELVTPYLSDWALLLHVGDDGAASTVVGRHRDPRRQDEVDALVRDLPTGFQPGDLVAGLLAGRQVRVIDDLTGADGEAVRTAFLQGTGLARQARGLGGRRAMIVALSGRSGVSDVLVLVRSAARSGFDDEDVTTALDLGRRAGLIMENVRLYETQSRIADVLQRSLLPDLPSIDRVTAEARYLANDSHAEVGGDFYELLAFRDGSLGIAVGDVSGHDILAAAAMGHLRGLLRAVSVDGFESPGNVLEEVDHLMLGLGMPTVASAAFAHVAPYDEGWRLTWSSAGHPPLVVRRPDADVEMLPTAHNDPLLGVTEVRRTQHSLLLPSGSTVLAYTDGLVERRDEVLDVGFRRLVDAVADAPADPGRLCDHVISRTAMGARDDDIALLAVTLG